MEGPPRAKHWAEQPTRSPPPRSSLPVPLLSVAPMMEWTDNHFRFLARLLTRRAHLYTEMVVDNTLRHNRDDLARFLEFPLGQHPLVLQLGGSNPEHLADAARMAAQFGYDELNLNCGCPSDKVAGHGCFGAILMLNPELVGDAAAAMEAASGLPVTIKCRIGVDDRDSYEELCNFIRVVSTRSGVRHFIIHARKAILGGLNPHQNRTIPPLRHDIVYALLQDFPHLQFTLNGMVAGCHEAQGILERGVHGVMLGRAAYHRPWDALADCDRLLYGEPNPATSRRRVVEEYCEYGDATVGRYGPYRPTVRALAKPLLGLFHGKAGARAWKREMDAVLRDAETVTEVWERTRHVFSEEVLEEPPGVPDASKSAKDEDAE